MQELSLAGFECDALSIQDLMLIDGGHHGAAYELGHEIGSAIAAAGVAAAAVTAIAAALLLL